MLQIILKILIFILTLKISVILGVPVHDDCDEIHSSLKEKYDKISDCYCLGYPGRLNSM